MRISVSQLFAQFVAMPRLAELREQQPGLCIDLNIDDRLVNMAHEGIDIAVRAGVAPQDTGIARDLGHHGRALFASSAFIKTHGTPRSPADLPAHSLITNKAVAANNRWRFSVKRQIIHQDMRGQLRVNNNAAVDSLTLPGCGIGGINDVVAATLVMQSLLKPLLGRYNMAPQYPVYGAVLAKRQRAPKIRFTMDFLALCFAAFKVKQAN